MTRVSSKMTFFYKRIFPVLFCLPLLAFVIAPMATGFKGGHQPPPFFFFVVPVFMAIIFYTLFKKLIFDLVDEVWDDGDALVVRNGSAEERIPLGSIKNVSYATMVNPPRVTLSLRQPSQFGSEVSFCAPFQLVPFKKSAVIEALIDRIDAARRR
jgi:hypothetical protein